MIFISTNTNHTQVSIMNEVPQLRVTFLLVRWSQIQEEAFYYNCLHSILSHLGSWRLLWHFLLHLISLVLIKSCCPQFFTLRREIPFDVRRCRLLLFSEMEERDLLTKNIRNVLEKKMVVKTTQGNLKALLHSGSGCALSKSQETVWQNSSRCQRAA